MSTSQREADTVTYAHLASVGGVTVRGAAHPVHVPAIREPSGVEPGQLLLNVWHECDNVLHHAAVTWLPSHADGVVHPS